MSFLAAAVEKNLGSGRIPTRCNPRRIRVPANADRRIGTQLAEIVKFAGGREQLQLLIIEWQFSGFEEALTESRRTGAVLWISAVVHSLAIVKHPEHLCDNPRLHRPLTLPDDEHCGQPQASAKGRATSGRAVEPAVKQLQTLFF